MSMLQKFIFSCLIITLSSFSSVLFAQEVQSKIRVFTKPKEAIIQLDGKDIEYGKIIELDTGKHELQAWSIGRKLTTKQFTLKANEVKPIRIELKYNDGYKKHRKKVRAYKIKKTALRYAIPIAYLGYASKQLIDIGNLNSSSKEHLSLANKHKKDFETSFWKEDIVKTRTLFIENKAAYQDDIKRLNAKWPSLIVATGLSSVLGYLTWKKSNKLEKPYYTESPQLSRLSIIPLIDSNVNGIYLTLNF